MKKVFFLSVVLVAAILMGLIPAAGFAQTYVQDFPPAYPSPTPDNAPKTWLSPCYYCIDRTSPPVWKWHIYNRFSDIQLYQRSDLNPESTLDYMLRTF